MIPVLELKRPELRAGLDAHLARCGIAAGWLEEGDILILTVPEPALVDPARRQAIWYLQRRNSRGGLLTALKCRPLTGLLILASTLVSLWAGFGGQLDVLRQLTIVPFAVDGQYLQYPALTALLDERAYWRLLTPVLLHFSLLHLVFNLLWMWILGGSIEQGHGTVRLLVLTLSCGVISNLAQFPVSGPLFGGLSGVVYGLLGYCWTWRARPAAPLVLPVGLYVFMLAWLVLGYTGFSDWIGLGRMANAAHLAGLGTGLACGLISVWIDAKRST